MSYFPERLKSPPLDSPSIASLALSPGPAAHKTNALQNRISSVLSASYADLDIRDSLATLESRGIRNTAETRRNLRLQAQQEVIACNGEVIDDFGKVSQQLKRVGAAISDLNRSCQAMRSHIAAANREVGPCLEESASMMAQRSQTETKKQLLNAFTSHFLLSDEELSALTSTAEPVNDAFFHALTRVKKNHDDSQVLLGSEDQHLGLEILEQSSKQLNAAYQKLFRWTQRELKTLDLENPQLSINIRRALRVLADRPALFQNCLDFFAENRDHILSDTFYSALTGGASAQANISDPALGKAIELNAHDPLRYVSDMLAWAHSATVGEREALQVLFVSDVEEISRNIKASREREPWARIAREESGKDDPEAGFDGRKALNELVDRDLAGVLRQLRQRVEQVLQSHEDATLAYQISNLVTFYNSIFASLLGDESGIVQTLRPITQKAFDQFKATMRDHIANIHGDVAAMPADLSSPDFLTEALNTLTGLMKSYDTSLANATKSTDSGLGFRPVLEEALDPYLAGCDNIAQRMTAPQSEIFGLNCLLAARETLKGYVFTQARLSDVERMLEERTERLTQDMRRWFLAESGLQALVDGLGQFSDGDVTGREHEVRKLEILQPERLVAVAQRLDAFLPAAMEDARAHIEQLEDKRLVREICEQAADMFTGEFEEVERLLAALDEMELAAAASSANTDPEHGEEQDEKLLMRDLFPRTSDEIKVLLS